MLLKASTYVKSYDGQTRSMYFLIKDYDLLEKYNTIRYEVSADIKKNLIAKQPCLEERIFENQNKPKSHGNEVTDFADK